jgi:hypothetical protein
LTGCGVHPKAVRLALTPLFYKGGFTPGLTAGTDQTAGFVTAPIGYVKGIVASTEIDLSKQQMNAKYFADLRSPNLVSNPGVDNLCKTLESRS